MAADAARLASLRAHHPLLDWDAEGNRVTLCADCDDAWPCAVGALLARVARLERVAAAGLERTCAAHHDWCSGDDTRPTCPCGHRELVMALAALDAADA